MRELQKPYFCIEGPIGAGKTTLCNRLGSRNKCHLILEEFDDNPFLPAFYEHPSRYAFPVELFFMNERLNQLTSVFRSGDLFADFYLADYFFPKTSIFAHENLSPAESKLFKSLYNQLSDKIPSPTIVFYLSRPMEILMKNIKQRGRSYEDQITVDYLHNIDRSYRQYFEGVKDYNVVIYELETMEIHQEDFLNHIESMMVSVESNELITIKESEI